MSRPPPKLEPGDRVAYAARFLRSIGVWELGPAERRGTVVEVVAGEFETSPVRVRVRWDDEPDELESALPGNLARVGTLAMYD